MDRLERLLVLAGQYDVVVYISKLRGDLLACWIPSMRRIFLEVRLTDDEQCYHLAHELGHVHLEHPCARTPSTPAELDRERQADRFAARVLIEAPTYARLEAVNSDQHYLADELGVPVKLLRVYEEDLLTKVRGVTYAQPREGVGQWAHRQMDSGAEEVMRQRLGVA
ncbi:ImmA/IrrE family metallo-endopeptidase [Microbacterium gorillae]|uniref:ImmA/IrrE family metallo-endopeptidase n=1 Tax=Microbacterium gorillae TaxID=1231063 RepID=UPI003D9A0922